MNNDLISRSELKKCAIPCQIHNGALTDLCVTLYQIDNAPTVETDIEVIAKDAYDQGYSDGWKDRFGEPDGRPKGEWIMNKDENPECPFCHHSFIQWSNFCSNCGADMRGGAE